jgi:serine/threonine-protein phosphatase 2B catalytic subunit
MKKNVTEEYLPDPLNDRVIKQVNPPPHKPLHTDLLFPKGDNIPDWKLLKSFLQKEGKISKENLIIIINLFIKILKSESNIIYIADPVTLVGDIHGQYYDLLKILEVGGNVEDSKYCFLGDFVDRGSFSIECVILLMSIKINFPDTFTMLRGNHESRQMTSFFNFYTECVLKYDEEIYNKIMDAFDALPLAAIINNKFLSVHGGISPKCTDLSVISNLNRYTEIPKDGLLCDLLWSDPFDEESDALVNNFTENSKRGCSYQFGAKALLPYLSQNKLLSLIRAHEAQLEGFKMYKWNKKIDFPAVITVFSAPNYCDVYNNKGAVIKFKNNLFNLVQFNYAPHPFLLPDFQNLISWSLPFVSEKISEMLFKIINFDSEELVNVDQSEEVNNTFSDASSSLKMKIVICATLLRMLRTIREEHELIMKLKGFCPSNKIPRGMLLEGRNALKTAYDRYTKVKSLDAKNEKRPLNQ